jgi:hypothetical protein
MLGQQQQAGNAQVGRVCAHLQLRAAAVAVQEAGELGDDVSVGRGRL